MVMASDMRLESSSSQAEDAADDEAQHRDPGAEAPGEHLAGGHAREAGSVDSPSARARAASGRMSRSVVR